MTFKNIIQLCGYHFLQHVIIVVVIITTTTSIIIVLITKAVFNIIYIRGY